jgi:molecular chaperone DnaJ
MAGKRDYYDILQVDRNAAEDVLKASYRKLAMKYHPDRNPGDKEAEEKFKEAAEAFEVLRDPRKRGIYDQYGHQGLEGSGFSGFGGFEDIFSSFGDIFENFFGFGSGSRGHSRSQKGADLRYDLDLNFMDAAFGTEMEIKIEKRETCSACSGNGAEPGTHPETCSYCRGAGQVTRNQGFFTVRTTCPSCRGAGQVLPNPCARCKGTGQVVAPKTVVLKIPAGVDNGSRLRLTAEGEAGVHNGPPGDLYVFIHVKPHEFFERSNTDVICQLPISFVQAALGDKVKVPTLNGEKTIEIPKGTQPGDLLRLRGEGIPSLREHRRGDQIIQMIIKTPTNLSKKQEDLLRDFARLEEGKFTSKLKNLLKSRSATSAGRVGGPR